MAAQQPTWPRHGTPGVALQRLSGERDRLTSITSAVAPGLGALLRVHRCVRNTPASAGRTPARPSVVRELSEHPRVGGEDHDRYSTPATRCGTPPRRRGGPYRRHTSHPDHRNTPASAGKTCSSSRSRRAAAEHPRVGGEDASPPSRPDSCRGTPPRRRGGRLRPGEPRPGRRNTPASAGRTARRPRRSTRSSEHPRVGGEDTTQSSVSACRTGTPPRRRGGQLGAEGLRDVARNTPASAGRTGPHAIRCVLEWEHPRVGGEDTHRRARRAACRGTPPRRRGGRRPDRGLQCLHRNTPASAGRTARWGC